MEFAGLAVTTSSSLHTLHIEVSDTSAEVGDRFMQGLADHRIHWLQNLTLQCEDNWFKRGRDGCMQFLIMLLARQTNLQLLNLTGYDPIIKI